MTNALVIRGHFDGQTFVPTEPLPCVRGEAELIVFPQPADTAPTNQPSIYDLFGRASHLRTGPDIEAQLREERDSWGEP